MHLVKIPSNLSNCNIVCGSLLASLGLGWTSIKNPSAPVAIADKAIDSIKVGSPPVTPSVLFGHMRSTSCAAAMNTVESFRSPTTFADQVRGLHVYGRKVLSTASVGAGIIKID